MNDDKRNATPAVLPSKAVQRMEGDLGRVEGEFRISHNFKTELFLALGRRRRSRSRRNHFQTELCWALLLLLSGRGASVCLSLCVCVGRTQLHCSLYLLSYSTRRNDPPQLLTIGTWSNDRFESLRSKENVVVFFFFV